MDNNSRMDMAMPVEFRTIPPSKQAYSTLFDTTGWNREYQATPDELAQAVANSQFVVAAYDGARLVGFGRVLTDGVLHAMIYDMIVEPVYQDRGLGTQILRRLVGWCHHAHIRDIQLFCAQGKSAFYEKNGFVRRAEGAPGMEYRGGEEPDGVS